MLEAREDPGKRDIEASETFSRIQQQTAPQGGFHERPQRSRGRIQRRGDARVHERKRKGSDTRPRRCKVPRPSSESAYREPTITQWCRRCQTGSPRVRRCKLTQSGGERVEKTRQFSRPDRKEAAFTNNVT